MVAEEAGSSHAVATSAGTNGLHAALVAVGVGQDDLVVLPNAIREHVFDRADLMSELYGGTARFGQIFANQFQFNLRSYYG